MEQKKAVDLLKKCFNEIEQKYQSFFMESKPRWPGEERDFLRNHHKNLDNLSMKNLTFDRLGVIDLPVEIVNELEAAFESFRQGVLQQQ
jgi:hypothetical protein